MNTISELRLIAEGAIPLDEVTKFNKYGLYNSDLAKSVSAKYKEGKRLAKQDDKKGAKAAFNKALADAKELKQKASKIPNNDFGDWFIDLCIKPLWWLIVDLAVTSSAGYSVTEMSRSQAVSHFDAIIKSIEHQLSLL